VLRRNRYISVVFIFDFFFLPSLSVVRSPQGQRFRSRASLHAFLLKDGEGILDINLFDFTASKDDVVSKGRRRTRKKRHAGGRKETTDSPPSKSKRASPCLGSAAADGEAESRTRAAPSTAEEDDVGPRESPSSRQRNTPAAHKVDSRPPVPTLNVEPATESEDEEEGGGGERKDEGDCECSFDLEADSRRDEEAAFPDTAGGSCTPVGDSQNSEYDHHGVTAWRSSGSKLVFSSSTLFFLFLLYYFTHL